LLALPGDAVGADDLGLVSVEVEVPVSVSAAAASPDRGDRSTAQCVADRDDRIEIVTGSVLVRLPMATAAARVAEIAVALGARR
jgi:transposase